MSKKGFISLGLLGFICIIIILIFINKPNEDDFAKWFEDHFNVQCEDDKCYTLKLSDNSGDSVKNRFSFTDGYYDNAEGFLGLGMQTKRLYRSINDRNLFFSIEVKGFFGNFEVIDFSPNKVDITMK
ncbi:hypothetical protein ACOQFO_06255 [Ureibacillus sp. MALMAid1270]|uniref:hypothetical protein n=1 Tax=Ureibacillus sp. MALMAid1270 TaxID=3411629 RepID=UPI003BA56B49